MATVICEKHGLRFDPERADGCVLCRRERGGESPAAAAAASVPAAGGSLKSALAWTVGLWLAGGTLLYLAHDQVATALRGEEAVDEYAGSEEVPIVDMYSSPPAEPAGDEGGDGL
jgi:hypothetical protein